MQCNDEGQALRFASPSSSYRAHVGQGIAPDWFGQRLHALYESFVAQIDLLSQGVLPQRYFGGGSDQVRITTRTPKPVGGDQNRLP